LFISTSSKKRNALFLIIYIFCLLSCLNAQQRKYAVSNAHAHNDYNHPKPFATAYEAGFGSIEADVIFRNDHLYVAHDAIDIKPGRTLQSLYLNPLKDAIKKNNGYVFKDPSKHLLFLIDLKTPVEATLHKVIDILKDYPEITSCPTLRIVITGNQPDVSRLTTYPSYIYFDGNFKKNYTIEALEKIALFSDNFKSYSKWNGTGYLTELDKAKIDSAVTKAHSLSKPIRFWAAPDLPDAWFQLMKLDVDYINTDMIYQMSSFLNNLYATIDKTWANILDEVTITAQRKAQLSLNVPYSTQSVSQAYLDNYQPRTTPEALLGTNGVFVQKTNHGGGSPFLRGLTGNQTLILVDGIRLNNSTFRYGPNQYLNTIDAFTINKIEVAKGTGSVQYGSDAIGGVLQVFTKEPRFSADKNRGSGRVIGKYMTGNMEKTVRSEAGFSSEKTATSIGATHRNFGDLIGGDTTGKQSPSGYKELAVDAKTKLLLKRNAELTLAHQFLKQQHVPVYHKIFLENFAVNEFDPQQRMLNYAKLKLTNKHQIISNIEMIGSWQQTQEGRNSRKNGSNTLRKERDKIKTLGFTTDVSSSFSEIWSANSGIELYTDKVNSTREDVNMQSASKVVLRGLYPDDSRFGNYSLYSLHHLAFNKWIMESGIRYNAFSINISDTTLGQVKINPSSFVYNVTVLYKVAAKQNLYLTFNTGYRAPNIDDMGTLGIVDFRYEIPTKDLAPERSQNIEVGYKLQTKKIAAALSGFFMHLTNLITRVKVEDQQINGYPVYRKENVEKGHITGFETEVDYQPLTGWNLKGNLAYTYGQNLTKDEPLSRIPPLNGRLLSTYNNNRWFGSAELLFASNQNRLAQGDKDDNRIPKDGTPGWNVLNVYAGYSFTYVKFNIGLQNLFNEDYRTHGSGINGTGRSAWLSASIKI